MGSGALGHWSNTRVIQNVAMCMSFTGLYGVTYKRPWGPFVCGCASTIWFLIALRTMPQWAVVELAYALVNFGIAFKWRKDEVR